MGGMGSGEFVRDEGVKRWIYGVWIILIIRLVCVLDWIYGCRQRGMCKNIYQVV